jgi:hypothetical protein
MAMEKQESQHPDPRKRLAGALELVRAHVAPTISLVEELIVGDETKPDTNNQNHNAFL